MSTQTNRTPEKPVLHVSQPMRMNYLILNSKQPLDIDQIREDFVEETKRQQHYAAMESKGYKLSFKRSTLALERRAVLLLEADRLIELVPSGD